MESVYSRAVNARVATIVWLALGGALLVPFVMAGVVEAATSAGTVSAFQKISNTEGGYRYEQS